MQCIMKEPTGRIDRLAERRRYRCVRLSVPGRYMLINKLEYPCRTRDMSPVGWARE